MKIIADENIPYVQDVFGGLGDVVLAAGRKINPTIIRDADALLVRSVTQVNESLLAGSKVRFVGTATIGFDHIDVDYLSRAGIAFSSAAGSNSNSVVEYVLTAILTLAQRYGWSLTGMTLGIIGVGNIGSRLEKKAAALGLTVLPNDPPLQRRTGDPRFLPLDQVLQADVITCHVPMIKTGDHPTYHLLNDQTLGRVRPDTLLINSSRGAVVDNATLKQSLAAGRIGPAVLDVWEGEPNIDAELLERVVIGTPHIAGYSLDGKVNGTIMLYEALAAHVGQSATAYTAQALLPEPPVPALTLDTAGKTDQAVLAEAMAAIYNIRRDDHDLRGIEFELLHRRGDYFDRLRKEYPTRRESHNTSVRLNPFRAELADKLSLIGFRVEK